MSIITFAIASRLPSIPHSTGADTFSMLIISDSLNVHHHIGWVIHPYSLFGMTPGSYPYGLAVIISSLSQSSGLDMDISLLIINFVIVLMGGSGAYVLSKEIIHNDALALLSMFTFIFAPLFVVFTIWTGSSRAIFMAFLPWILFFMLRFNRFDYADGKKTTWRINYKYLSICIIFIVITLMLHRTAMFIPVIAVLFIASMMISKFVFETENSDANLKTNSKKFIIVCILASGFFFALQYLGIGYYAGGAFRSLYQTGFFFQGTDPNTLLINMLIDYTSKIGIVMLFIIPGMLGFFFIKNRARDLTMSTHHFVFLSLLMVLISSFMYMGMYITLIFLALASFMMAYGMLFMIYKSGRKRVSQIICTTFIVATLLVSMAFVHYMIDHQTKLYAKLHVDFHMNEETVQAIAYLNNNYDDLNLLSANSNLGMRIKSFSWYPDSTEMDLDGLNIEQSQVTSLLYTKTLFTGGGKGDWMRTMPIYPIDTPESRQILKTHDYNTFIELNAYPGQVANGNDMTMSDNIFLKSVREQRYSLFKNDYLTLWDLSVSRNTPLE